MTASTSTSPGGSTRSSEGSGVRFEISKVLDAIEGRLTTDPALARAVRRPGRGGPLRRPRRRPPGQPAAARAWWSTRSAGRSRRRASPVYAVAPRALLSDADLTSNERMVVRRWADDGLVEVLHEPGDRVLEVADLLGLPVLSRSRVRAVPRPLPVAGRAGPAARRRCPAPADRRWSPRVARRAARPRRPSRRRWARSCSPGCGAARSRTAQFGGGDRQPVRGPAPATGPAASRRPRCGTARRPARGTAQRLRDAGPRPRVEVLSVRVDGVVRQRFVVADDQPVVVGRAPEDAAASCSASG